MIETTRLNLYNYILDNKTELLEPIREVFQDNINILTDIEEYFFFNSADTIEKNDLIIHLKNNIKTNDWGSVDNFEYIQKNIKTLLNDEKKSKNKRYAKHVFNKLLNILAEHSNNVIDLAFNDGMIEPINILSKFIDPEQTYKKVFLSYAYTDKAYTLALFLRLLDFNILLYVDWMHNKKIDNGINLKDSLNKALRDNDQLLFLRSKNSELHLPGATIRPWCAWELGSFYMRGKKKDKFYVRLYDYNVDTISSEFNLLLDGVTELTSIKNGRLG